MIFPQNNKNQLLVRYHKENLSRNKNVMTKLGDSVEFFNVYYNFYK